MSQPRDPYRGDARRPYQQPYVPQRPPYGQRRPAGTQVTPPPVRRRRRIPGGGLILTLVGLLIQVLSLTVLPWVGSGSLPQLWDLATEFGTHGFGAWYVVLFSYPLAALGILLALATVLDSVALKVIWGGLALVGLGYLVLRFGFGPFVSDAVDLGRQEITTAIIAVAAAVGVVFVLKTAMSMFRRVAGLILLGLAGVHVAAVIDLVKGGGADELGVGAFGPAVGYVLIAIAAFTAPRRIPGV